MAVTRDTHAGMAACRNKLWKEAYHLLSEAEANRDLDAGAVEALGDAAYMIARETEAARYWASAHNRFIDDGDVRRAARIGFRLSLTSLLTGEGAASSGWLARSERLLESAQGRAAEEGLCILIRGLRRMFGGDPGQALPIFDAALELAVASRDPDLLALALLSRGQALVALGRAREGVSCLDEAMISVTQGSVSPIFSGILYCAVILTCNGIFDCARAREWTSAFDTWCSDQPGLIPFRGQCLIHRSEILQMQGNWDEAIVEAQRACNWLAGNSDATLSRAHYQMGELYRLTGASELAETSYREVLRHGGDPQPGFALLKLCHGDTEGALAAIRNACGPNWAGGDRFDPDRLRLLGPAVEILLEAGDLETAEMAIECLGDGARAFPTPVLEATLSRSTAAFLEVTERPNEALDAFRSSFGTWQRLGVPYEEARTRVGLARVCHTLGDHEAAKAHSEAARETFTALNAAPDLAAMARIPWLAPLTRDCGLSKRQIEVLRLVADGLSNHEIASNLGISEHTVARHISNVFDKAGVSSRAAAVSYAHRRGLLM